MTAAADTERFYASRDEAQHQLDCIEKVRRSAYDRIAAIAAEVKAETGCSDKDVALFLDHVHDGFSDMLADVEDRWQDERADADEAISNAEWTDLMLSRVA